MSVYWEDLSELSIFKCKVCTRRLQAPVMEVEAFGNICGPCYDRSVYTTVSENTIVQKVLSKLCVPCIYAERGCTLQRKYMQTLEHEKTCLFRDVLCPFTHPEEGTQCENVTIKNIISHIRTKHEDNVILAENNIIKVPNPTSSKCNVVYLLVVNDEHYLLQTRLDVENNLYTYIPYYLDINGNNNYLENRNLSFITNNTKVNIKYTDIIKIEEIIVDNAFNMDDALTLNKSMLENFGCVETIKILIEPENDGKAELNDNMLKCFKCANCENYCIDEIYGCDQCKKNVKICNKCYASRNTCQDCTSSLSSKKHYFTDLIDNIKVPCQNVGCGQLIKGNEYELHQINCMFKTYNCIFINATPKCLWESCYPDLSKHLAEEHDITTDFYRDNSECGDFICGSVVDNNIIKCEYALDNENFNLKIGVLGPAQLDNLYTWKLQIVKANSVCEMIITNNCLHYSKCVTKSIDVREYLVNNKLKFSISIQAKDVQQ